MISPRETVAQTAIRIVREWADIRLGRVGDEDMRDEIEADRDIVTAWLLGQDANRKGGRAKR